MRDPYKVHVAVGRAATLRAGTLAASQSQALGLGGWYFAQGTDGWQYTSAPSHLTTRARSPWARDTCSSPAFQSPLFRLELSLLLAGDTPQRQRRLTPPVPICLYSRMEEEVSLFPRTIFPFRYFSVPFFARGPLLGEQCTVYSHLFVNLARCLLLPAIALLHIQGTYRAFMPLHLWHLPRLILSSFSPVFSPAFSLLLSSRS